MRFDRKTYEFKGFLTKIGLFLTFSTNSLLIVRFCKTIEALALDSGAEWAEIRKETDILSDFKEFLMVFKDFWIEETDLRL